VKLVLGVSWEVRAAVRRVVEDSSEVVRAVNIEVFGCGFKLLEVIVSFYRTDMQSYKSADCCFFPTMPLMMWCRTPPSTQPWQPTSAMTEDRAPFRITNIQVEEIHLAIASSRDEEYHDRTNTVSNPYRARNNTKISASCCYRRSTLTRLAV
jgi:hypothetical protein